MAKAKIVRAPPSDHIPEPLVAPIVPAEVINEESVSVESTWEDGNYAEEIIVEPSPEEIEQERKAQEIYEKLQLNKLNNKIKAKKAEEILAEAKRIIENPPVVIETVVETVVETVHIQDPETLKELKILREENLQLQRINEAAEKIKEEKILTARKEMTERKGNQLNIVKQRKPSLVSKVKEYLRQRRISKATIPAKNYEVALISRSKTAIPKILDEIEKIHEELVILEELLSQYLSQKK